MAPAPADPPSPHDQPDIGQHGQREQAEDQHEPYGPLDVERHVKDDGRALILYARREHKG